MHEKLRLSMKFIKEAEEQLQRYEATSDELYLHQACEKGWAAVTQALKVINPDIKRHADFGRTALKLAQEFNNKEIMYAEAYGEHLHRAGFYEGQLSKEEIEFGLITIKKFLELIDNILNQKATEQ
jgi:hypothetical protein